jgi:hypothetical protein
MDSWAQIPNFDRYLISRYGNIKNKRTGEEVVTRINNTGTLSVMLYADGRSNHLSVARLVAHTFVPNEYNPVIFDTPIHLDGNRRNCSMDNLVWRPRWFAIKFHKQFDYESYLLSKGVLHCEDTNETFESVREVVKNHGVYCNDVLMLATNKQGFVFPQNYKYHYVGNTTSTLH